MKEIPIQPQKANILVVDDDVFISGLYGEMLTRAGYSVTYARNGREGLKEAGTLKYDLVLLDVVMPEMDGFETLSQLKSSAKTQAVPVIMLTGMSQPADVEKGLADGAAAYLAKTKVIPSDAIATIEQVLSKSRTTKKPARKPAKKSGSAKKK